MTIDSHEKKYVLEDNFCQGNNLARKILTRVYHYPPPPDLWES
jgi:hypothetical protein